MGAQDIPSQVPYTLHEKSRISKERELLRYLCFRWAPGWLCAARVRVSTWSIACDAAGRSWELLEDH